MAERVAMYHPSMLGDAHPLKEDVPKWEAVGWLPKRRPLDRATDRAEPLASPVKSAKGAKQPANGKGKK